MLTMSKTSSSLAWNWVMESLADVKDIDTTVLENLVKILLHGKESLDTRAKERLALRHLFDETDNVDITNLGTTSVIDVAESAQDVYNRIRNEMETSNLPDSLKLDIRQFAIQKKSRLPKCQLQQLEEALSQHGQSSNEILIEALCVGLGKRKDRLNNGIQIQTPDVNHTHSFSENQENHLQEDFRAEPSNITSKDGTMQVRENSAPIPSAHDAANISEQCRKSGELQPVNELASASAPKNLNDTVQVDPTNDVLVSGKRKRCEFSKDQHLDSMDTDKQNEMELSTDQVLVPEPHESPHGKTISSVQIEASGAQVQAIDECERVSKRSRASANCPQTEDQEVTMEDANGNVQKPNSEKLPHKSQASILYSQEEVAVMKSSFIDFQKMSAQDSVESVWAEEHSCMKCNKRNDLLDCCVDTCPIIVHEKCLGASSANFDTNGKFYCPLCSYSQALSAYHEAKEKASRAKKIAEVMRNRLNDFMNLKQDHVDDEAFVNQEPPLDPPPANAPRSREAIENQQSLEHTPVIAPPEPLDCPPVNRPPESLERPLVANAPRGGEAMENQESLDHLLVNAAQESNVNASVHCDSINDGQGPVNVPKEFVHSPSKGPPRPLEEIVDSQSAATKTTATDNVVVDGSVSRKFVLVDQEDAAADVGAETRDLQRGAGPSSSGPSITSDPISVDVSVQDNSNRGFIFRKRNRQPPSAQTKRVTTRRVKTRWADKEVAILEEGVRKFGISNWKSILEFGKNVFNECRVPGDLKDKWRNMQKGN